MLNLEVKIQKTELAKSLEETLNIKWELNRDQIVLSAKDNNLRYL